MNAIKKDIKHRELTAVFRADSSDRIGIGHIVRCLTIAEELKSNGYDIYFICKDHPNNMMEKIKHKGFNVELLPIREHKQIKSNLNHGSWLGGAQLDDAKSTINFIKNSIPNGSIDLLVIDHYAIDKIWQEQLRPFTKKILVIDDIEDRVHDCDFLVDQTFGKATDTYNHLIPKTAKPMVGEEYILLRPEFQQYDIEQVKNRRKSFDPLNMRVLIMMGGTDPDNFTSQAIDALITNNRVIEINVILSSSAIFSKKLDENYTSHPSINIYIDSKNIPEIMLRSDIAIGAGGGSSWERCKMGLPCIINLSAKNQSEIIHRLERKGACKKIEPDNFEGSINSYLEIISNNYPNYVESCISVCDGNGVKRVLKGVLPSLPIV